MGTSNLTERVHRNSHKNAHSTQEKNGKIQRELHKDLENIIMNQSEMKSTITEIKIH